MAKTIQIRLEMGRAALEEEREAAKGSKGVSIGKAEEIKSHSGPGLGKAHFIDPVSAAAVVTLAWVTKRLVDHWLKSQESGVQVDLRTAPVAMSRIAGVPHGFLVIIDKGGKATTQQAKYDKPEDLMPLIQQLLLPAAASSSKK